MTVSTIPKLISGDLSGAREWFAQMGDLGLLWHPDDPPSTVIGQDGSYLFDENAVETARDSMQRALAGSKQWPDPDFIYALASVGRFQVEVDYPGFVVDASVPCAMGLQYVSIPGQKLPTILTEECGRFVAVSFSPPDATVSTSSSVRLVPLEGVSFSAGGVSGLDRCTFLNDHEVTLEGRYDEAAVEAAIERMTAMTYAVQDAPSP